MHISSFFIPSSDLLYRFLVSISVAAIVIEGSLPKQLEFGQFANIKNSLLNFGVIKCIIVSQNVKEGRAECCRGENDEN
jgi:hypothetical protein